MFAFIGAHVAASVIAAHEAKRLGIVLPKLPPPPTADKCDDAYGLALLALFLGIAS